MYNILKGLRVIEATSFVASPSAGLYLAQLGAEVIRVDHVAGGPDYNRWPKADNGSSFYWEGLNKAKKSVSLNLKTPEGREILKKLAASGGETGGILLTNFPVGGFLSYENMKELRQDIIVARVMGQANGGPAVDYTVNCALGVPNMTGPASLGDEPVNHVLPAWDLLAGAYTAFAILAAERRRRETGEGADVRIPLSDIGVTSLANLGQIAEVLYTNENRARYGNEVYGAFGKDFVTADGKRLIVMAISPRQWAGLVKVLKIEADIAAIEKQRHVSFDYDEGVRFEHRDVLYPLVTAKIVKWESAALKKALDDVGGCWGEYQTLRDAVDDPALVKGNPIFTDMKNPSGFTYPTPGSVATLGGETRGAPKTAPTLGQNSEDVLAELLGMGSGEITSLIESGIVKGSA
ncbi:MAG: CoA transferase [Maricaulaceae bacterium]